ncbi:MAG: GTPase HflX, partial [bacterium]
MERAYLVGVSLPDSSIAREKEHLEELQQLATTAGAIVVGKTVQGRTRIDGATFIGPGKAEELKVECERLNVNLLVFDSDLSPAQARNLEKIFKINVIDRTELILDIFARHAKTQQA